MRAQKNGKSSPRLTINHRPHITSIIRPRTRLPLIARHYAARAGALLISMRPGCATPARRTYACNGTTIHNRISYFCVTYIPRRRPLDHAEGRAFFIFIIIFISAGRVCFLNRCGRIELFAELYMLSEAILKIRRG